LTKNLVSFQDYNQVLHDVRGPMGHLEQQSIDDRRSTSFHYLPISAVVTAAL
jgi:hypothetical protein